MLPRSDLQLMLDLRPTFDTRLIPNVTLSALCIPLESL